MLIEFTLALLLAGCSSSSLSNVYLLSLSYTKDSSSATNINPTQTNPNISTLFSSIVGTNNTVSLQVRTGYMGFCMMGSSGVWLCDRHASTLANFINQTKSTESDPLNLIWISNNFQHQVIFDGLMCAEPPPPPSYQ